MGGGGKAVERRAMNVQLVVRIDNDLSAALAARAVAENIPRRKRSRLYRTLLRAGLVGGWIEGLDKTLTELKTLRGELSRIGSNLNQVAHWLNIKGSLKDKELLAALDELRPAVKQCCATVKEMKDGIIQRVR